MYVNNHNKIERRLAIINRAQQFKRIIKLMIVGYVNKITFIIREKALIKIARIRKFTEIDKKIKE